MAKSQPPRDLRKLLKRAIELAQSTIQSLTGINAPPEEAGYVWRWAFLYLVLAQDLGETALVLSEGSHARGLLILRRIMFEHMIRLQFYRANPVIAKAHLDDFEPQARLFQERLADPDFKLILDPAFDPDVHDPKKRDFYTILEGVVALRTRDLYARFYMFPSSLIHGSALAFGDVLELKPDGSWHVHGSSRRTDIDKDVLFNYIGFLVGMLIDATQILGTNIHQAMKLGLRLNEIREALGIEVDFERTISP